MAAAVTLHDVVAELRTQVHVDVEGVLRPDVALVDVFHDSRRVTPSSLFCAVPGAVADGHAFVHTAVERGAAALLVERFVEEDVPQLRVACVRDVMPRAAAYVHGHPSRQLDVFGITGTNGKTTTTHLLASLLVAAGRNTHVIGTLSGLHTTPEAPEFQRELRGAVEAGVQVVAAEISSHALHQHRVDATEFAVAAFSNLTADHLDYHGTMDRYFDAKRRLFDGRARRELINVDDDWGEYLARERTAAQRVSNDDVTVLKVGIDGTLVLWRDNEMLVPIPGAMNVANALIAAEAALLLGIDAPTIAAAMGLAPSVPGRMQRVRPEGSDPTEPTVIVDYSHTPDSLERALQTIRQVHGDGRVLTVFGCGGDRDRTKRPLMGQVAERHADLVYVTSDNPRSEDPRSIIDQIVAGMDEPGRALVCEDRRDAITAALAEARPDDVVLIAGKGHESTQTIGDKKFPFDDVTVAREVLDEANA